jgi:hypothetical protein
VVGLLRQGSRDSGRQHRCVNLSLSCKRIDQRVERRTDQSGGSQRRLLRLRRSSEHLPTPRRHCHCHGTPPLETLSREGAAQIKLGSAAVSPCLGSLTTAAANIFSSHTSTVPAVDRKVRGRSEVRMEDLIVILVLVVNGGSTISHRLRSSKRGEERTLRTLRHLSPETTKDLISTFESQREMSVLGSRPV